MATSTTSPATRPRRRWPVAVLILLLAGGNAYQFFQRKIPAPDESSTTADSSAHLPITTEAWPKAFHRTKEALQAEIKQLRVRKQALADSLALLFKDSLPHPNYRAIYRLNINMARVERQLRQDYVLSACSFSVAPTGIQSFAGVPGMNRAFCLDHARHAGLLRWCYGLEDSLKGRGTAGQASGKAVGSGCLVAPDLFLTAGHCFTFAAEDTVAPRLNGVLPGPEEAAHLMRVVFNYAIDKKGLINKDTSSYPVLSIKDIKTGGLDYAVLQLGPGADGQLAGAHQGYEALRYQEPLADEQVAIIQHPDLTPFPFSQKINVGMDHPQNRFRISYADLSTSGGSSGSPIISTGGLIGIHICGDCNMGAGDGNQGISLVWILDNSEVLRKLVK